MKSRVVVISLLAGMFGAGVIMLPAFYWLHQKTEYSGSQYLVAQYKEIRDEIPLQRSLFFPENNMEFPDFTLAAEKAVNAVVHIKTQFNAPNYTLYDYLFGTSPRYSTPVMSSGSGVILSSDGYIITNNHVVEEAEIIQVILNDKRMYDAKIIGKDAVADLALLKIEENNLPYLAYANSDAIRLGEWVLAIGNPFNLTSTVTAGIVSAKARNISILGQSLHMESFIQTDAAVNPGNSGGALVNLKGELIGINTAIASRTGSFVGYSFAIPSNIVAKVVADFIEFGDVQRAYLGIEVTDIDANIAKSLNMLRPEGVYVAGVWNDANGKDISIGKGDVILEINGFKLNSVSVLMEQLSKYRPGEKVDVKYLSNGKIKSTTITLRNKYGSTKIVEAKSVEVLGASFEPLPENEKQRLRLGHGVKVKTLTAGKLLSKGVREGYIITKINNTNIYTVEDIEKALKESDGAVFIEGIYPNGTVAYYAFGL